MERPASALPVLHTERLASAARACPLIDGDPEAWVACCSKRFFPLARRIAGDDDLANDALQESWVKILEAVHVYRGGSPACAWVRVVVVNCGKDRQRKRKREASGGNSEELDRLEDPTRSPEVLAIQSELTEVLLEMIAALPATYRQVVELRYQKELSTKETARLLQLSPGAVAVRLHRAVSMLRNRLEARVPGVSRGGEVRHLCR